MIWLIVTLGVALAFGIWLLSLPQPEPEAVEPDHLREATEAFLTAWVRSGAPDWARRVDQAVEGLREAYEEVNAQQTTP